MRYYPVMNRGSEFTVAAGRTGICPIVSEFPDHTGKEQETGKCSEAGDSWSRPRQNEPTTPEDQKPATLRVKTYRNDRS